MLACLQGGGEVQLNVPTVRALPPISLLHEGMVKRVRGVAHSMRVSPQNSNRMVGFVTKALSSGLRPAQVLLVCTPQQTSRHAAKQTRSKRP